MLQPERLKKVFFFQSDLTFITDITAWWFQLFLNGGAPGETGMFYIIWLLVSNIFYFHPENWRATGSTNGAAKRDKKAKIGEDSHFDSYFSNWVETTNQIT